MEAPTRQFSFRLPVPLVERVEQCVAQINRLGLSVTRADVVRLLLTHALEQVRCDAFLLFGQKPPPRRPRKKEE